MVPLRSYLTLTILVVALYQQLGEKGNEMENDEYQKKKLDELQRRLTDAYTSMHHLEIVRVFVFFDFFAVSVDFGICSY